MYIFWYRSHLPLPLPLRLDLTNLFPWGFPAKPWTSSANSCFFAGWVSAGENSSCCMLKLFWELVGTLFKSATTGTSIYVSLRSSHLSSTGNVFVKFFWLTVLLWFPSTDGPSFSPASTRAGKLRRKAAITCKTEIYLLFL